MERGPVIGQYLRIIFINGVSQIHGSGIGRSGRGHRQPDRSVSPGRGGQATESGHGVPGRAVPRIDGNRPIVIGGCINGAIGTGGHGQAAIHIAHAGTARRAPSRSGHDEARPVDGRRRDHADRFSQCRRCTVIAIGGGDADGAGAAVGGRCIAELDGLDQSGDCRVAEISSGQVDGQALPRNAGRPGGDGADNVAVIGDGRSGGAARCGDQPHRPNGQLVVGAVLARAADAGGDVTAVPGTDARQIGGVGDRGGRTGDRRANAAHRHVIDSDRPAVGQGGRTRTTDCDGVVARRGLGHDAAADIPARRRR